MKKYLFLILFTLIIGDTLCARTARFYSSDKLSSSLISCIVQDKAGYIWIGTEYGLNRFDGYRFTVYLNDPYDNTSLGFNVISSLYCDDNGNLWVGTARGLDKFDYSTESFSHYRYEQPIRPRITDIQQLNKDQLLIGTAGYGLYSLKISTNVLKRQRGFTTSNDDDYYSRMYIDKSGAFWKSGSNEVLTRYGLGDKTRRIKRFVSTLGSPANYFEIGNELIVMCLHGFLSYRNGALVPSGIDVSVLEGRDVLYRTSFVDKKGNVYIGTRGDGLYWIPAGTKRLQRMGNVQSQFDFDRSKVWAINEDHRGNLWIGCQQQGLLMIPDRNELFGNWNFSGQKMTVGTAISSVCEGDNGMLWCTVQYDGVYGFDRNGNVVAHPQAPDGIEFIYRDSDGDYWIGTDGQLYSYNPFTGASKLAFTFPCDKFYDMCDDRRGHLYISTFSRGLCVYDKKTHTLKNFNMYQRKNEAVKGRLCNDWVMALMPDKQGNIWIGTSSGVSCYDPVRDTFKPFGWNVLLDGQVCYSLCQTQDGYIVLGMEQGLYRYCLKTKKVERFPHSLPLSNKVISYIVADNDGDLWCSTSMGIWHYQRSRKRFIGYVNGNGLTMKEYTLGVGSHTSENRICFSTSNGLVVFNADQIKRNKAFSDEVFLTGFLIGGKAVNNLTLSDGEKVINSTQKENNHFTVSYLDNTFTMEFSQFNYANADNVIYEYRLNGSQDWSQTEEGRNSITFIHMQPGAYTLEVRAFVNGAYSDTKVYTIIVRAPWYKSPYAYLFYIMLFLCSIGLGVLYYSRKKREQLDEEKMKFLINATHDIRSPLTLIMSPLEKLKHRLQQSEPSEETSKNIRDLSTIERNANRILNLVNQILDVRKIDKQQMKLNCEEVELVSFINGIVKMYEYTAQERNIHFTFESDQPKIKAWIDRVNFDKVVTNLLSNAFKYTYDAGEILLKLSQHSSSDENAEMKNYFQLEVIDNGMGLNTDNPNKLFNRFYRGNNNNTVHINGTGIGLNLCKMIVTMHHGTIEAANRKDEVRGSIFTVRMPLGKDHLKPEELLSNPTDGQVPMIKKSSRTSYHVLVVDDDAEIGKYISNELGEYYHFTTAPNGKEGLKALLTKHFDIVISDVMMPEMDGFTMLRMIKTNVNVNHIPVIMLTSKSDVGNRLEGLEKGADAFLAKPFNMDELHVLIDNLINRMLRLKGKFSGAQEQREKIVTKEIKGNDEILMEKIVKAVNENLSNSDFSVDMLTEEVGISRAQLHRKMKDITGIPASEFIRNIRLEQAARLLREQKINVTQVAYSVGFNNLAHFSTVFRKHFGLSPSEYIEHYKE